jgi:hypothetical protein
MDLGEARRHGQGRLSLLSAAPTHREGQDAAPAALVPSLRVPIKAGRHFARRCDLSCCPAVGLITLIVYSFKVNRLSCEQGHGES